MVKTIVVVDDDPGIIHTVKAGLEDDQNSYRVIGVKNGKECIDLLQEIHMPDLIFLDIMMPEMSGWETQKKIREHRDWKNIPIVFLTARTDRIAKEAGSFIGEDYIEKPFNIPQIKQCIEKILH